MDGRFMPAAEIAFTSLDWGKVGALSGTATNGARQLTIMQGHLLPGKGHDFHRHPNQEEVIFVLAGRIEQWVERDKRVLEPGDSAFIPADMVHASFNVGDGEATILAILSPSIGDGYEVVEVAGEAPWNGLRR